MCAFSIPRLSLSLPLSSPLPSISIYDCFLFVSYFLFHIHILHPCVSLSNYFDGFFIFHFSIQIIFFTALSISFVAHLPVHFHSLPLFRLPQRVCVCVYFCVDKVEAHYMSSIPALHFTAVAFKMHYNVLWIRTQRVQRFVNELRTSSVPHHSETRSEWDDFKIENTMEKKEETKIHHPYTYTSTE